MAAHQSDEPPAAKARVPKANLRADLLRVSRSLLDEGGPSALSMREVSRRTGCTHQAPYHYFANRQAILAELIALGFTELRDALRQARDLGTNQDVVAAQEAAGNAYVDFALANPGLFRIMFRPDMCDQTIFPAVQEAGEAARAELSHLAQLIHGEDADPEQEMVLWSHVHGLASLLLDGPDATKFPSLQERREYAHLVIRAAARAFAASM